MTVDVAAARAFVATHGRLLDRRRLDVLLDGGDPRRVLAALDGYRNVDGGYGWGLEPDLRAPESQPAAAMHAIEVIAEIAPTTTSGAVEICDWLDAHTLPDGGLPFALPVVERAGCADLWLDPDVEASSLQMTAQVAANTHLVAVHDPAVRRHPWLGRSTEWCLSAIRELREAPFAYELMFAVRFLDAAAHTEPEAVDLLERLRRHIPADGIVPVQGGIEGEALRALDFSPRPAGAARRLFSDEVVDRELGRLAHEQQADGGWTVGFSSASPAGELEWRGYATLQALQRLQDHGRLR